MINLIRKFVIGLIAAYILVAAVLYVSQRELMFSTSTQRTQPNDLRIQDTEEVTLRTKAGEHLYSWYAPAKSGHKTVLYLHGNGGSVSSRQSIQRQFIDQGYGVFMLGYPGYGGSEGSPSEAAFVNAANLGYTYLKDTGTPSKEVVIFGESLGSAVAIQLAAERPAAALILAAPMSSIREIAQAQYPFVPMALLLKDPFLSIDHISRVSMPILIFHGTNDQAIPISSGKRLFEQANNPKAFYSIGGAGHNNLFEFEIIKTMGTFLDKQAEGDI